jgi:hypothetical protein
MSASIAAERQKQRLISGADANKGNLAFQALIKEFV